MSVIIAYDSTDSEMHNFFTSCADEIKQICVNNGVNFTAYTQPNLSGKTIMEQIVNNKICSISAHGYNSGISVDDEDIISTKTTNYNLNGKALFAISCDCGQDLRPELKRIGLKLFVGYDKKLMTQGDLDPFVKCVTKGIDSFLQGCTVEESKTEMMKCFDQTISELETNDDFNAVVALEHDQKALVFDGDSNLTFSMLN